MSNNKSFSGGISQRYALALFEISDESSELDDVELKVSQLLKIYNEHSEFRNFSIWVNYSCFVYHLLFLKKSLIFFAG